MKLQRLPVYDSLKTADQKPFTLLKTQTPYTSVKFDGTVSPQEIADIGLHTRNVALRLEHGIVPFIPTSRHKSLISRKIPNKLKDPELTCKLMQLNDKPTLLCEGFQAIDLSTQERNRTFTYIRLAS